jgi:hypothetical protein
LQIPDRDAVRIEPSGHDIPVQAGEDIQAAALRLAYRWPTMCHGDGESTVWPASSKSAAITLYSNSAKIREPKAVIVHVPQGISITS